MGCDMLRVHGGTGRFAVLCIQYVDVSSLSKAAGTHCLGYEDARDWEAVDQCGGHLPGKVPGAELPLTAAPVGMLGSSGVRSPGRGDVVFCSSLLECFALLVTGSGWSLAFGHASLGHASCCGRPESLLAYPHHREKENWELLGTGILVFGLETFH